MRFAHPLNGKSRASAHAFFLWLRRSVHYCCYQELVEVSVGLDQKIVLPEYRWLQILNQLMTGGNDVSDCTFIVSLLEMNRA